MLNRTIVRPVATAPTQYVPYRWLLHRLVQHGCAGRGATQQLLHHPEAPPPWDVFSAIMAHSYADRQTAIAVIEAAAQAALHESQQRGKPLQLGGGAGSDAVSSSPTVTIQDAASAAREPAATGSSSGGGGASARRTTNPYTLYPHGVASDVGGVFTTAVTRRVTAEDGLRSVTRQILQCPRLGRDGEVLETLCRALLVSRQRELAADVFLHMPVEAVSEDTWLLLVRAARLTNTAAVDRLVALDVFPLSWALPADAAAGLMLWGGATGGRVRPRPALAIMRRYLAPHILHEAGVPMPRNRRAVSAALPFPSDLQAAAAAIAAWSAGVDGASSKAASAEELLALLRLPSSVKPSSSTKLSSPLSSSPSGLRRKRRSSTSAVQPAHLVPVPQRLWGLGVTSPPPPDPVPFRVFFEICRAKVALTDGIDSSALHWRVVWRSFQLLNRTVPAWYADASTDAQDAEQVVLQLVDVVTRGASPWLSFHLAHHASRLGLVDGVDVALFLLMRTHRGQYVTEGAAVARLIFSWLLGTAAIYRRPERQGAVLNACRVLIQLGMQAELTQLYDLVLDHAVESPQFRRQIVEVLRDVICPSCNAVLRSSDPHKDRQCEGCGEVIKARANTEVASFQLTETERQRKQARISAQQADRKRATTESVRRKRQLALGGAAPAPAPLRPSPAGAQHRVAELSSVTVDAATRFRDRVLAEPTFGETVAAEVPSLNIELLSPARSDVPAVISVPTATAKAASPASPQEPDSADADLNAMELQRIAAMTTWSCCWCGETNKSVPHGTNCGACGAYSGPRADWRRPFTRGGGGASRTVNPIHEFRDRVRAARADSSVELAVGAGMFVLLYRRAFVVGASEEDGDFEAIKGLVALLCSFQQRVLAAALYFNVLPQGLRKVGDDALTALAEAFGLFKRAAIQELASPVLRSKKELAEVILGPNICQKCFGEHPSHLCPLVTREFTKAKAPGGITPEHEKVPRHRETLHLISTADADEPLTVESAYASFLTLPDREDFATTQAQETNFLARLLRRLDHVKRAALVVCHVPLHLRTNEALSGVCTGFSVDSDDYAGMLHKRKFGDAQSTHPNFVQLTRTCCICFDEQHASHACPRLQYWLYEAALDVGSDLAEKLRPTEGLDRPAESQRRRKFSDWGPAAGSAWLSSGPERRLAFSRFLVQRIDEVGLLAQRSNTIANVVNQAVVKLAVSGNEAAAFRIYAWTPAPLIYRPTTAALLRVRGFPEVIVKQGLQSAASGTDWHLMALPADCCLLCFRPGHSFYACPELQYLSQVARWVHIATYVACFKLSNVGVLAAAQALAYDVSCGSLTTKRLREAPDLAKAVTKLVHKCFASGLARFGVALLRVLPAEHLTVPLHTALWRAAGKSAERIEKDKESLAASLAGYQAAVEAYQAAIAASRHAASAGHSINTSRDAASTAGSSTAATTRRPQRGMGVARPSSGSSNAPPPAPVSVTVPPPATTKANVSEARQRLLDAQTEYRRCMTADLCHRCYQCGHEAAACDFHVAELDLGRDMISSFRIVAMDDHSFRPDETYEAILRYARFIAAHHRLLPFQISSVTRAVNAVAALLAMMDNAPAALRLLLYIPPCYRASHVFAHILVRFSISVAKIDELIRLVPTPADIDEEGAIGAEKTTLNVAPFADNALERVFSVIPNIESVLESGEHQLAARDVTDPNSPTKVALAQHGTLEALKQSLLDDIIEPIEAKTGGKVGSRMIYVDAPIDELTSGDEAAPEQLDEGASRETARPWQHHRGD
jgi:hypothetical protein